MKLTSKELKSFFYGTLLGDAYIHNNTFYCKQISEDLIEFKKNIIEQHLPDAKVQVKRLEAHTDKNGVHHQVCYVLSASKSEYIKKLRALFYPNGKKILPKDIIKQLTPLGLAMWYADDGTTILVGKNKNNSSAKNRRVQLCTDNFTLEELERAVKEFQQIGYEVSLLRRREGVFRIQFGTQDRQKLICNIYKYFLNYFPSLLYKMDLGYRDDSLNKLRYVSKEYKQIYNEISVCPLFYDRMKER